jgi:peptidoglycan/xylan/chitin deacetylase (PgdA/CDA1 family)
VTGPPRRGRGSWPLAVGLTAGGAVAAYWVGMSPYSQLLAPFPYRGDVNGRVVALTFDDGPNEPYTSQIADFLDERGIKATFFQVGRAVRRHPEVTARLARSGHAVGHHGYSHQFTTYLRRRTLDQDIQQGLDVFARLNVRPTLYRPPWLLRTPALRPLLDRYGLHVVSGEFCHPLEVFQPDPRAIARRALAKTRPGSILIFHDGVDGRSGYRGSTVEAVKVVVDRLTEQGYGFATVDQFLGLPAG